MRTLSDNPSTGSAHPSLIKRLERALLAAKLDLGERMYAAGIDEGSLGARLTALGQRIRQAEARRLSLGLLLAQRRDLLLQLAAAALEEDAPLPGAEAEYRRAKNALATLKMEAEGSANTASLELAMVGA